MENNNTNSSRYRHYMTDMRRYYRMPIFQVSITAVLSLLLTIIFIVAAIKPTLETIAKLKKTIADSEATLEKLKTKEAAVQKASEVYETLLGEIEYVESSIPSTDPGYDSFVKTVEIIAKRTGVVLGSESLGGAVLFSEIYDPYSGSGRQVVTMPVSIKVTGLYPQVREFLRQLTSADRIMDIQNLNFGRESTKNSQNTNVSLTMTGNIAYVASEETVNKILGGKSKNEK